MKISLIYPGSNRDIYAKSKVRVGVPHTPSLSLATVAAALLESGDDVRVLDLGLENRPHERLIQHLREYEPDYVGITFSTPQYSGAKSISETIKSIRPQATIVSGGSHSTALPEETLNETKIDIVAVGEGDYTLRDIVHSNDIADVDGISYKRGGRVFHSKRRTLIEDLDSLPHPALNLFEVKRYRTPRILCKRNPTVALETSRGCVFNCIYCNKNIFERRFRPKSPLRVVEEMKRVGDLGFKEVQIMDDGFSTDLDRAKKICDLIISESLDMPWTLQNGIRADRVDAEFLQKAAEAGCHRITYGVETGDQRIMDGICKGETLEDIRRAFRLTHDAGIKTTAFFLFGLPGETEQTMKKTIDFAKELDPDICKVSIMTPFPGTKIYETWSNEGLITSRDWSKYNQHDPSSVYTHPSLKWETIMGYYSRFYREYYLRPHYVWKRIKDGLFNGEMFYHIYYGVLTKW